MDQMVEYVLKAEEDYEELINSSELVQHIDEILFSQQKPNREVYLLFQKISTFIQTPYYYTRLSTIMQLCKLHKEQDHLFILRNLREFLLFELDRIQVYLEDLLDKDLIDFLLLDNAFLPVIKTQQFVFTLKRSTEECASILLEKLDTVRKLEPAEKQKILNSLDSDPDSEEEGSSFDDSILVSAFATNPEAFERNAAARKSQKRIELIEKYKYTHEIIEGWALMFNRNPRKNLILYDLAMKRESQPEVNLPVQEKKPAKIDKKMRKKQSAKKGKM